jgi:acetyl-CoA carboxylase carboxyl transferase subunit alpha
MGLIDRVVAEPMGGAHRDPEQMMQTLRRALTDELARLQAKPVPDLLETRIDKLMSYGKFKETAVK